LLAKAGMAFAAADECALRQETQRLNQAPVYNHRPAKSLPHKPHRL
jgi:hypothetical protein